MRRFWILAVPLVLLTVVTVVSAGRDEKFAVDPDASWTVTQAQRFLPPDWGPAVIQSVSPKGSWAYGYDETNVDEGACYWETATWERTCPDPEPGEVIGFSRVFAWSPDDATLVTPTYMLIDERRYVERLVRIDLATGNLTELYRPEAGTYISQIAFSPDGSQVAFIELAGDTPFTIQRIDRDGGEPETILTASETVTLSDADNLYWTGADQIVFYSGPYATDTQGYFRINSDGTDLKRLTAVTPAEQETRIRDISADGRYMIAEGMDATGACGPDFVTASSYVVDLERDAIAQVVCAVYHPDMPDARGANLFATTRAVVTSEPAFLPDGTIVVLAEQRAGDDSATGLALIDVDSGRISVVSNDMDRDAGLWDVSAGLPDGSANVWAGGYWRHVYTLDRNPGTSTQD